MEGRNHFLSNLIAAGTNRRAEHRDQVSGHGGERSSQFTDSLLNDPGQRAAPTRMDRRNHAAARIGKQQREAIRRPNLKQKSGIVCDERIARRPLCNPDRSFCAGRSVAGSPAPIRFFNPIDGGGMNLLQQDRLEIVRAESAREPFLPRLEWPAFGAGGRSERKVAALRPRSRLTASGKRMQETPGPGQRPTLQPFKAPARNQRENVVSQKINISRRPALVRRAKLKWPA